MKRKNIQVLVLAICPLILAGCDQEQPESLPPPSPTKKSTPAPEPVHYHLYIPTGKGKLHKRVEKNSRLLLTHNVHSGSAFRWSEAAATEAVKRLLKAAPDKFPPGTKLLGNISRGGGQPKANFSRAFAEPNWWKEPIRAEAALYALVNTAIKTTINVWSSSDEESLTFYVEGKPLGRLGNFDFSKPFEPNESLVETR